MRLSATRSELLLAGLLLVAAPVAGSGFPPPEQALKEAFPGAGAKRETWALSTDEVARVKDAAGSAPESRLVAGWTLTREGVFAGVAFLDAHEVRSKRETLLVSLAPDLTVVRVDVLAFAEPGEYLASPRWLEQFHGRALGPGVDLKRDVRGITGATLTSRAITASTRRALAIAALLRERGALPALPAAPAAAAPAR